MSTRRRLPGGAGRTKRLRKKRLKSLTAIALQRNETASRRVAIITFNTGEFPSARGVYNNGTVSFMEFPDGKFIVTNFHVWNQFRLDRKRDNTCRVYIAGTGLSKPLDISDAVVVSENEQLDLCVLSFPHEQIEVMGKEYARLQVWPPFRAQNNDGIAIVGFPGIRRQVKTKLHPEDNREIEVLDHQALILWAHVYGVSDRKFLFKFQHRMPEVVNFSDDPPAEYLWGGMSGSLVYSNGYSSKSFVPCGILHAAGEGLNASFYATHLDFINSDGTINNP